MRKLTFLALVLVTVSLAGCNENYPWFSNRKNLKCMPSIVHGIKDSIIGQWQLTYTWVGNNEQEVNDVSCSKIIFNFDRNGTLTITGTDHKYAEGKYPYTYTPLNSCETCLPARNLFIGSTDSFFCNVQESSIEMNCNEGTRLFVRIK